MEINKIYGLKHYFAKQHRHYWNITIRANCNTRTIHEFNESSITLKSLVD